jgi:tRNA pseudouridine38-40 synthase
MRNIDAARAATYKLLIEYEGTRYSGWQEQRNARTVAGELLRALEDAGFPVADLGGSGRTDAGVHALAQCAHLRLAQRVEPAELCRAINRRLPRDIHVLAAAAAPPSFHARHDAVARGYLYQISRRRTALAKPWVWWVRDPLDVERMRAAAAALVGRHDFRHFADVDRGSSDLSPESPSERSRVIGGEPGRGRGAVESTAVEVERVEIAEAGALVLVRMVASHFLWKMVRRVVGTLAQVGAGRVEIDDLVRLLGDSALGPDDPRPAQWTAPPSGLFLERVLYAGDPPLDAIAPVTTVSDVALGAPSGDTTDETRRRPARHQRPQPKRRPPPRPTQPTTSRQDGSSRRPPPRGPRRPPPRGPRRPRRRPVG